MTTQPEKLSRAEAEWLLKDRGFRFKSTEDAVITEQSIGNERYEVDALEMTRSGLLAWINMRYAV